MGSKKSGTTPRKWFNQFLMSIFASFVFFSVVGIVTANFASVCRLANGACDTEPCFCDTIVPGQSGEFPNYTRYAIVLVVVLGVVRYLASLIFSHWSYDTLSVEYTVLGNVQDYWFLGQKVHNDWNFWEHTVAPFLGHGIGALLSALLMGGLYGGFHDYSAFGGSNAAYGVEAYGLGRAAMTSSSLVFTGFTNAAYILAVLVFKYQIFLWVRYVSADIFGEAGDAAMMHARALGYGLLDSVAAAMLITRAGTMGYIWRDIVNILLVTFTDSDTTVENLDQDNLAEKNSLLGLWYAQLFVPLIALVVTPLLFWFFKGVVFDYKTIRGYTELKNQHPNVDHHLAVNPNNPVAESDARFRGYSANRVQVDH